MSNVVWQVWLLLLLLKMGQNDGIILELPWWVGGWVGVACLLAWNSHKFDKNWTNWGKNGHFFAKLSKNVTCWAPILGPIALFVAFDEPFGPKSGEIGEKCILLDNLEMAGIVKL